LSGARRNRLPSGFRKLIQSMRVSSGGFVALSAAAFVDGGDLFFQLAISRDVVGRLHSPLIDKTIVIRRVGIHPYRETQPFILAQVDALEVCFIIEDAQELALVRAVGKGRGDRGVLEIRLGVGDELGAVDGFERAVESVAGNQAPVPLHFTRPICQAAAKIKAGRGLDPLWHSMQCWSRMGWMSRRKLTGREPRAAQ